MRRWGSAMVMVLLSVLTGPVAEACLWDNDTLRMERSRFPGVHELIAGKFPRHSRAFYEWRLRDRLPKIDGSKATLPLLDDVAVAYDKTGQHDMAVLTMLLKEQHAPGAYETYANLGTFLIHRGDLEAGLPFIDEALRINPNAHFGRERYQKLLVEYVLARRAEGRTKLPLRQLGGLGQRGGPGTPPLPGGFAAFLRDRGLDAGPKATKGILGMMRFGRHDSPILLEALADLLIAPFDKDEWAKSALQNALRHQGKDAKRLAVRAYLKASYAASTKGARRDYRVFAEATLRSQSKANIGSGQEPLEAVEKRLKQEIAEGDRFADKVAQDEQTWIQKGLDAEKMFALKYFRPGR